ncbi:MAG: TetR/AcrR family transcriptional regulator [Pseudomonadota bacterium]|nr:TetR/AcrR family transcriptional regulator [Pseudomonadota bacterium]
MSTVGVEPARADDQKEAAIIAGARKTFLARGFDAASMDAIALMAGVSKRTVYNRFRSKEELFAAAIHDTCERILPLDIEAIEASLPPKEFIRQMSRIFLQAILEPEAIALRRIAAFEAARTPALGRSYLEHGPRLMVKTSMPIVERLTARGTLKIDNAERAIWQLGALITEPLYTEVLMGAAPADLEAAIDEQIESGVEAFLKLYGA